MKQSKQINNKRKIGKDDLPMIKRILSYVVGAYKVQFIIVLIGIIFSSIASVAGSLFLEILIDDYISPLLSEAAPVFTGLLKAIFTMGLIYLVGLVSTLLYNQLMVTISQGVLKNIRDDLFSKMQSLPIKYFDTHSHGDVMSFYTNDIDALRQMVSQSITQMFSAIITIIAVFSAMITTSLFLTLLSLVFVILMLSATRKIGGMSSGYFAKQQQSLADVNGYVEEMINGQKVVKVFCHEQKAKDGFDRQNDMLFEHTSKANTFASILMPVVANLGNLQYIVLAVVGGALVISGRGGLTLGAIVAFLQLSRTFTMPINTISQQINSVIMALAGARRVFALMDEEPEVDDGYVTLVNVKEEGDKLVETEKRTGIWAWKHPHEDGTVTYTRLTGDVRFYDVDFGYDEKKIVLHDITLYANQGQKIAFVGATGAGKTTITNLINRFYDLADGKIRYDGININKIKKSDLRHSLGIVLQDTNLFTDTIMENIRYGKLDATDEEVYEAARLANADNFIRRLPNEYNTVITGDGGSLSQGQRQLISIARAAIADPPVMILDEATSSIDTHTEAIVQSGMDQLMNGRTVFVIAHRLSTIQNSDAIMVLNLGNIIERGNHTELVEKKGYYYQLYTGAFELD